MDGTQTGITNLVKGEPWSNGYEEVPNIHKALKLEAHLQMQFSVIPRTLFSV